MLFSEISESEFALVFVKAKRTKIEKILKICNLDVLVASWVVYEFILEHRENFQSAFKESIDVYRSDILLPEIIDVLTKAQKRGVKLQGTKPLLLNNTFFVT